LYRPPGGDFYNEALMEKDTSLNPGEHSSSPASSRWKLYVLMLVLFVVLYALTAQRGPAWQDSGAYQWRILNFDLEGDLGLALAHPLLVLLSKLFSFIPILPVALRINLLSALCGAVAVANVAMLVRRLAPNRASAAWIAAGFLAMAHTFWWLATICESQMLLLAIFTTELHILVTLTNQPSSQLAMLLGVVNGLALTAHNLALLALPAYGVAVIYLCLKHRLRWGAVALFVLGWLIGAAGFLTLIFFKAGQVGLFPAVLSALFGKSWQGAVTGFSWKSVAMGIGYVVYNFPNLAIPLMLVGLWRLRRRRPRLLTWVFVCLTLVYFLFAVRYRVMDQFMFFLPFYAMTAILAGIALGDISTGARRWVLPLAAASVFFAPLLYLAAPPAWKGLNLPLPGRKDLPRDAYAYWLRPWKGGEDSAGKFARSALQHVPPGSVILADSTSYFPLIWTQRVENMGKGVRIVSAGRSSQKNITAGSPNIYVVSRTEGYYPSWMKGRVSFEKDEVSSVLYHVIWKSGQTRPAPPAQN